MLGIKCDPKTSNPVLPSGLVADPCTSACAFAVSFAAISRAASLPSISCACGPNCTSFLGRVSKSLDKVQSVAQDLPYPASIREISKLYLTLLQADRSLDHPARLCDISINPPKSRLTKIRTLVARCNELSRCWYHRCLRRRLILS